MALPAECQELRGQVAVITGAGAGIGRATTELFGRHGARLALLDLADERGEDLAATLTAAGAVSRYYRCDVTRRADVERTIQEVLRHFGQIDVLVSNAGGSKPVWF